VVLDLHLPDISGITVINELRHRDNRLPIIVMTGRYLTTDHEELARNLGAACFLRKPVDAMELAAQLRSALQIIPTPDAVRSPHLAPPMTRTSVEQKTSNISVATQDPLQGLHLLALGGDRSAVERLASELLGVVTAALRKRWKTTQPDWISDAVSDALLDYLIRPERFEPSRGIPLAHYIRHNANKNLLNTLDSERRRRTRQIPLDENMRTPTVSPTELDDDRSGCLIELVRGLAEFSTAERQVFRLWMQETRDTSEFARALAIDQLDKEAQLIQIRRVKERIRQRLRRYLRRVRVRC
jgi:CheY-like chemotaxis protein